MKMGFDRMSVIVKAQEKMHFGPLDIESEINNLRSFYG